MLSRLFPGAVERFEDDYDTAPLRERSYQRSRGHLRRHPATRRTRWLWLVPLAAGFLTVLGWVLAHDPAPGLALSDRGWLEIGLAGALVLLLSLHRSDSTWRLVRMLGEYAAVALLTVLLVTPPGVQHAPAPASQHPAPGPRRRSPATPAPRWRSSPPGSPASGTPARKRPAAAGRPRPPPGRGGTRWPPPLPGRSGPSGDERADEPARPRAGQRPPGPGARPRAAPGPGRLPDPPKRRPAPRAGAGGGWAAQPNLFDPTPKPQPDPRPSNPEVMP